MAHCSADCQTGPVLSVQILNFVLEGFVMNLSLFLIVSLVSCLGSTFGPVRFPDGMYEGLD